MSEIRFEIIVPCYNASWSLKRTIESFISQTYPNWRLWLVNDGSTDDSFQIAKEFVDGRILLFSGINQGASSAMNFARSKVIESSDPESFVMCCGADDWYLPEHLEVYKEEFEKDQSIDFLYSDVDCFFPDGKKAFPYGIPYHDVFDSTKLLFGNYIFTPTATYKVRCFSVGEFDSRLNSIEDWDFFCMVAKAGYKMVHLKRVLTNVTVRDSRWDSGLAGKRTDEQMELFRRKRLVEKW